MSRMELTDVQKLADELIDLRCDKHSLGNFYEFLLKAYGDANRAKADFMRLLSGDLPTRAFDLYHRQAGGEVRLGAQYV